jgi:hypothetical protein
VPSLADRLVAGLEAQDWQETASAGPWRRFGKFGRGAYYIRDETSDYMAVLWFSELHEKLPKFPVVGPIYDTLLAAGDAKLSQERPDTEALLLELMYLNQETTK